MSYLTEYEKELGSGVCLFPNVINQTRTGFHKCLNSALSYIYWLESRLKKAESPATDTQHTQAKMPSWGDVTKGITFSTVSERDVAAEVFSRVARHFGCA